MTAAPQDSQGSVRADSGVTAGRAAYEAFHEARAERRGEVTAFVRWEALDESIYDTDLARSDWEAAAQAAIATQQPQGALSVEWPVPASKPPAPDLGTAWRLLDEARELVAEILDSFASSGMGWSGFASDDVYAGWRQRARMDPP